MTLGFTRPPPALAAELDEVADAAREMLHVLQLCLNSPLPPDFPKDQLIDICRCLIELPHGTSEGCKAQLEYARNRLPAVRREHVTIHPKLGEGGQPVLSRGTALDQKLTNLISAVTTALDAYRKIAGDDNAEDLIAEGGTALPRQATEDALNQHNRLRQVLGQAQVDTNEILRRDSEASDQLKRQLRDAENITQINSAEVRMPRVMPKWLRKTTAALKSSPRVIRTTVAGMKVGVDVIEKFADRWHNFAHNGVKFIFDEIRKTLATTEEVIELLEKAEGAQPRTASIEPDLDGKIFLPLSTPVKTVLALHEVQTSPGQDRPTLALKVGRNEIRDLIALGLAINRDGGLFPTGEIRFDAETSVRRAFALTATIGVVRRFLIENPDAKAHHVAEAVAEAMGREWPADGSKRRYGNTFIKWAIWLEPHLIDPTRSSLAAARVSSAKSKQVHKGTIRRITPKLRPSIRQDLLAMDEVNARPVYSIAEISRRYGISRGTVSNDSEFAEILRSRRDRMRSPN